MACLNRILCWSAPIPPIPRGDEIEGQRGFAVVMRRSTGFRREYPIGFDPGWLARWRRDLEDGVFAGPPSGG